jgi:nitroreductase
MMNRRALLLGGGGVALAGAGVTALSLFQTGSKHDYQLAAAAQRTALPEKPVLTDLVRYATLAANSHNTQPWRFRISPDRIDIIPDLSRRTPVVDPDDHHLFVSLGCATENLLLAANARGWQGRWDFDPAGDGAVTVRLTAAVPTPSPLFDAIPLRQSTRAEYDGRPVDPASLDRLASVVAAVPGVDLVLVTDRNRINRLRDLVIAGNTAQVEDPAFFAELKQWIRFNPRRAMQTGDGLYSVASGNPALPDWLGKGLFDLVFTAGSENGKYQRQLDSSAGLAVFAAAKADREHWVRAGQACQRFALQATALGLKHAFLNQPVEVARLRPELASLVGMPGRRPDIVMRFGYGPALPYSLRRPVDAVVA